MRKSARNSPDNVRKTPVGKLQYLLLRAIAEEPYSTVVELAPIVKQSKNDVCDLAFGLLKRKLVVAGSAHPDCPSYAATPEGHEYLVQHPEPPEAPAKATAVKQ